MSHARLSGEIRIAPSLNTREVTAYLKRRPQYPDVEIPYTEDVVDDSTVAFPDAGLSLVRRAVLIRPTGRDTDGRDAKSEIEAIVRAFPNHTFTGGIEVSWEGGEDVYRLTVDNDLHEVIETRPVWPTSPAFLAHLAGARREGAVAVLRNLRKMLASFDPELRARVERDTGLEDAIARAASRMLEEVREGRADGLAGISGGQR